MAIICRPCITLRNGKRLCAHEVGKKAFCFEVKKEKPQNVKVPPTDQSQGETDTNLEEE